MSADWPTGIDFRSYPRAFEAIDRDPHQELIVPTVDERVVGTLQLRERNCRLVQLTTDKTRTAAKRFY